MACSRLAAEWRLGMWSTVDTNGRTIDMEATFRPTPVAAILPIKLAFVAWSWSAVIQDIVDWSDSTSSLYWFAYVSHLGAFLTCTFLTVSLFRIILPLEVKEASFFTKFVWGLWATVANTEVVITGLFWTLEYSGGRVSYCDVMLHGGLLFVLLLDGFILHRYPSRLKQFLGFVLFDAGYIAWLGIHSRTNIGNLRRSGTDGDDDAIYEVVNWNQRPQLAVTISVLVIVVVLPVVFLLMHALSFVMGRRYVDGDVKLHGAGQSSAQLETDQQEVSMA